ncbi:MAG: hypothetical protein RLZZ293_305 [Pseudomonadota bacterium]|jgi:electron transport complex protein RnfB
MKTNLIDQINALLPQTQCTRCSYPSCLQYAQAIAENKAEINQCPPGGDEGIKQLAHLLNKPITPLNPLYGEIKPRQLALIDEDVCIGCTLCIKACPVDAIIGANKMMHTVISQECTGCDLCIPVCPVDCISMIDDPNQYWDNERRQLAKQRFEAHQQRRITEQNQREARLAQQAELLKRLNSPAEVAGNVTPQTTSSDLIQQIMQNAKNKLIT